MPMLVFRRGMVMAALIAALAGAVVGCAHVTVFVATAAPDPSSIDAPDPSVAVGTAPSEPSLFHPYHSDTGRFSVEIPGAFKEIVKTADNPHLGPIEVHYFVVTPKGGPRYAVVYGDYPSVYVKSTALDVIYGEARAADAAAAKGRLLQSGSRTIYGYAADEHIVDGNTGFQRFVTVMVGDRGYSLAVRGTEAQVRSADADRFIESFAPEPG
jgi:hypothetical protein